MTQPVLIDFPLRAQHIVQRVAMPWCCAPADRLALLREATRLHRCAVHAYVLLDHHMHLLMTPSAPGDVGRVMRMLDDADRERGRAPLPGCRRSSERGCQVRAVGSHADLLARQRDIELAPVRAWAVSEPCAYRWSSHGANAWGDDDPLVAPHAAYTALGSSADRRRFVYRALFAPEAQPPHAMRTPERRDPARPASPRIQPQRRLTAAVT